MEAACRARAPSGDGSPDLPHGLLASAVWLARGKDVVRDQELAIRDADARLEILWRADSLAVRPQTFAGIGGLA